MILATNTVDVVIRDGLTKLKGKKKRGNECCNCQGPLNKDISYQIWAITVYTVYSIYMCTLDDKNFYGIFSIIISSKMTKTCLNTKQKHNTNTSK
jgi:hypothetical protein